MGEILWIAVGGALGALGRHGVGLAAAVILPAGFPYGTLLVNVLGSFLLGALVEAGSRVDAVTPEVRLALGTGVLGAFTTFSTFSVETLRLGEQVGWGHALANIAANVLLSLLGAAAGLGLARALLS